MKLELYIFTMLYPSMDSKPVFVVAGKPAPPVTDIFRSFDSSDGDTVDIYGPFPVPLNVSDGKKIVLENLKTGQVINLDSPKDIFSILWGLDVSKFRINGRVFETGDLHYIETETIKTLG